MQTIVTFCLACQQARRRLKCCNRSHHATAILAVAAEVAITKVHAPAVALTVLTDTPVPRIRKIIQSHHDMRKELLAPSNMANTTGNHLFDSSSNVWRQSFHQYRFVLLRYVWLDQVQRKFA